MPTIPEFLHGLTADEVADRRARGRTNRAPIGVLDTSTVTVIRDGRQQLVAAAEVVRDDVVELEPGAQVVADGEVLAADALEVDESLLSGESVPQIKDQATTVRSGSFVTAGRGWYRADKLGPDAAVYEMSRPARQPGAGILVRDTAAIDDLTGVDIVCIDKTGTLTQPVLDVAEIQAVDGDEQLARQALGALAWTDPNPNTSMSALAVAYPSPRWRPTWQIAFSSSRRFSGAGFEGHGGWVLGAPDVLLAQAADTDQARRAADLAASWADAGRRVLLLARPGDPDPAPVAVVALHERLRGDIADALALLRRQGVAIKVISGDDPLTVGAVARRLDLPGADRTVDARDLSDDLSEQSEEIEKGVVFGRAQPDRKQAIVEALQARGHTVAMIGDGANDVAALARADVGIAMGAGSPAGRSVPAPHDAGGLVGRALRFAVPAGTVMAAATLAAYMSAARFEARMTATITLLLVALWIVAIPVRRATPPGWAAMSAGLAPAATLGAILAFPGLRRAFDLAPPSPSVLLSALGVAVIAGVALELGWRVSGWPPERFNSGPGR